MLDSNQNIKLKIGESKSSLKEYLDQSLCKNAGIIPLIIDSKNVKLGAMNPMYSEVYKISQELKNNFGVNVLVEQISTEEWEKWFDNNDNLLNKSNAAINDQFVDETNKNTNLILTEDTTDSDIEFDNKYNLDNSPVEAESSSKKENEPTDKSIVEDITSMDQFDFVDFGETDEDEEEEEEEADIFDDSSLSTSTDPVVQAVGAILFGAKRFGASDIHAEPLENKMRIR